MEPPSHAGEETWNQFSATCTEVEDKDALLYELSGVFTDSKHAYRFLDELRDRVKRGSGPVVIDLTKVHHMSSCGVGILASCFTSASNAKRPLRIAGMSTRVQSVMRIVGLLQVIPAFASRDEALSARTS